MRWTDYRDDGRDLKTRLRAYFYQEMPDMKVSIHRHNPDKLRAAFAIRKWAAATATYSERALLIPPAVYWDLPEMLRQLQSYEGGLWCGGCAVFFTTVLNECYVPAVTFSYGQGDLSHQTTVVGFQAESLYKYYLLDAYLGYHFVGLDGQLLELPVLLEHVKAKRYEQVVRVDEKQYRHLLCRKQRAHHYPWLFDDGKLPIPDKVAKGLLYPGATHNLDKLLSSGGFVDLANKARGRQPLDEFMLDLMLVNPSFSRINPTCKECYLDWDLHEQMIKALGRKLEL